MLLFSCENAEVAMGRCSYKWLGFLRSGHISSPQMGAAFCGRVP